MTARAGMIAAALAVTGCAGHVTPLGAARTVSQARSAGAVLQPVTQQAISPSSGVIGGVRAGPAFESLPVGEEQAERARQAFASTCAALLSRSDQSGLTRNEDWKAACEATTAGGSARAFFQNQFELVQVGDGRAFATGYYEPEIAGARTRAPGYEVPVYARPSDLIEVDLAQFSPDLKGKRVRGRVQGTALVPYHDRAAIEEGALEGRARVLAWAADPIDMFFLQVQGSGRLRLPDGSIMRIGYADQNGREYVGIGSVMRQRGLLQPGQASMQGIVAWLRGHPEEGRALMRENKSFVFFRELEGPPIGAMGRAVTGQVSVAADPKFVPLGAPVFLALDRPEASGLWVAQDTGGAIKGANRFDTFWGAGEAAATTAGGMSARGMAYLLVPKGTLARLQESGSGGGQNAQPR